MQIRVVPGVCWERINLSQALSPSPRFKLFYIYTKKVLSPAEPRLGQPVTLPLREEVPWNRGRTPLGALAQTRLGCPGRFCPPRHPITHLLALKESRKLSAISPPAEIPPPLSQACFCQYSGVFNNNGKGLVPPFLFYFW